MQALKRLVRWLAIVGTTALLFLFVTILSLRWVNPPVTAFMLQQSDAGQRQYEWLDLDDISDSAALAVIAAEDQRYLNHPGIDLEAIEKALREAGRDGRARGASTITQQLAKNLFLWPGRNLLRKGIEAGLSVAMDALLTKRRILELYLNVVEFGPGIYGVKVASRQFFGKTPIQLVDNEAALLAAVLPNPKTLQVATPSNYVRQRQAWIRNQMRRLRTEGAVVSLITQNTNAKAYRAAARPDGECGYVAALSAYASRDAIGDAKLQFAARNTRFLGVDTFNERLIVPGIGGGDEAQCIRDVYSTSAVVTASPNLNCQSDNLVNEFTEYAATYNQQMRSLLQQTDEYVCLQ